MANEHLSIEEIGALFRKLKGEYCYLISHSISTLADSPAGFLGNHYRLSLKYSTDMGKNFNTKHLKLFMKTLPTAEVQANYVEEIGAFKKEVLLFKTLIPLLLDATSFLKYPWAPTCHIAKDDVLIFDDLSSMNYQMANQSELFDLEHCAAAMKTLADFHAASIIYERKNPLAKCEIGEMFQEAVKEVCYVFEEGHFRNMWLTSVTDACVYLCKEMGREEDSHLLPKIIKKAINVEPSKKWCNVLSHGDLWANNFMFNYDVNGKISHCILVDYQLSRYAPCALDIMCCLHLVAPKSIRDKHLMNLVNVYYNRLTSVLARVGLNIQKILPLDEIEESCAEYKQMSLVEACFYGTTIWIPSQLSAEALSDPDKCLDITTGDRTSIVGRAFKEDTFFRNQMTQLIEELLHTEKHSVIPYWCNATK